MPQTKPSFVTLLMLMSFASVNAVLFTPALPNIADYFAISDDIAQYTVSVFLIGYALGQLLYGPLANRYGQKVALSIGVGLQIVASVVCVLSGVFDNFLFLVIGRFLVALGSGVGLKMTFTLVNEYYEPQAASQKIAYLMLTFAITPGLGVALGGLLNSHFGWMSCFIAGAIYGLTLLPLILKLPKQKAPRDHNALRLCHIRDNYKVQFKNKSLILGALLMGASTCLVYVFAALAPFIAINIMGMNSADYGVANIIPSIGLLIGSLACAQLVKKYALSTLIGVGVLISILGALILAVTINLSLSTYFTLFVPMAIIYVGISFILANASSLAMSNVNDKAHGSALMSFLNMGLATLVVLSLGYFGQSATLLTVTYMLLSLAMIPIGFYLAKSSHFQ
ncbi:MAG: MFS transporter [Candidatus Berkiella sp.]